MNLLKVFSITVLVIAVSAVGVMAYRQYSGSYAPQQGYGATAAGYGYGYGSCPASGGSGSCCNNGYGGTSAKDLEAVKDLAAKYYSSTYGGTDFSVEVKDFGCHQEAYVVKEGEVLKRLSISGGRVSEVG